MKVSLFCRMDNCDVTYTAKHNLVCNLWVKHHDILTKPMKLECLYTQHKGLTCQDHASMNAWVLNNPLAQLCRNELKVIDRVKRHIELEWDLLEFIILLTPQLLKCMLVKLTFYVLFTHLGITTWGAGSHPPMWFPRWNETKTWH